MFNFGGPSKLDSSTQMQSNSIPYHSASRLNGYYSNSYSSASPSTPNGASYASPALQFDSDPFSELQATKPEAETLQDTTSAMEKHFYQSFRTGEFSDVLLTVLFANGSPAAFNLHSIVISRSSFLRDLSVILAFF